jgi:hypothetical protein
MAGQVFETRGARAAQPQRLKGQQLSIAPGERKTLAEVKLHSFGYPVLESGYYNGSAGATGKLRFLITLNGLQLPLDEADSYNPLGQAGVPAAIGYALPNGGTLRVEAVNEAESGTPEEDAENTFEAYADGEVITYVDPQ